MEIRGLAKHKVYTAGGMIISISSILILVANHHANYSELWVSLEIKNINKNLSLKILFFHLG